VTRVVLDTNVLVSGLGWSGPPAAIVEAVTAGKLTFLSSPALITERRVLNYPKLAKVFRETHDPLLIGFFGHESSFLELGSAAAS